MRIKGRRVALLLASALPLLADEAATTTGVPEPQNSAQQLDEAENDFEPLTAAEGIHHDEFKLPSLHNADALVPETYTATADSHPDAGTDEQKDGESSAAISPSPEEEEVAESIAEDGKPLMDAQNETIEIEGSETLLEDAPKNRTSDNDSDSDSTGNTTTAESHAEKVSSSQNETMEDNEEDTTENHSSDDDEDESLRKRVSVDYASKNSGALVIEKSKNFKGTSNLLTSDKDRYAIAPCEDKKFVVISLSEDIFVRNIKIANYERFSSTVKDFQILGSQTLGKWVDLGTYSAEAGNGEQSFDLKEPTWVRYLNFKFLSHHGVEYYCTYSQIQVHGDTMVQGFHEHWDEEESEVDTDEDELVEEETQAPAENNDSDNTQLQDENSAADEVKAEKTLKDETGEEKEIHLGDEMAEKPVGRDSDSEVCVSDASNPFSSNAVSQFCSSADLDAMLHGRIEDGVLLNELFNLIPSTLMTLPSVSRESPGRKKSSEEGDLRSLHHLGSVALNSILSSSKLAVEASEAYASGTITVPKMSDAVEEIMRLGRDLATRVNMHTVMTGQHETQEPSKTTGELATVTPIQDLDLPKGEEEPTRSGDDDSESVLESQMQVQSADKDSHDEKDEAVATSQDDATQNSISLSSNNAEGYREQPSSILAQEAANEIDLALAAILAGLPSADCLRTLDFTEMKEKAMAARKSSSGSGSSQSSSAMEPIFKKLTDEIKSLQTSLSVHDQYAKVSTACYRRVLFDVIIEAERKQSLQDERLSKLEEEFKRSQSFFLVRIFRWVLQVTSSFFVHCCSVLYVLTSTITHNGSYLGSGLYRFVLSCWPCLKTALLSWKSGAAFVDRLSPLMHRVDQLFDSLDRNQTAPDDLAIQETTDQTAWTFPMVPAIITLVACRVLMCCTTTFNKRIQRKKEPSSMIRIKNEPPPDTTRLLGVPKLASIK